MIIVIGNMALSVKKSKVFYEINYTLDIFHIKNGVNIGSYEYAYIPWK